MPHVRIASRALPSIAPRDVLVGFALVILPQTAVAQVVVAPNAPALRVVCVGTTGNLTFDANSNTTCAGAQTNITGITVTNGGGFTAAGSAGVNVTGSGGVSTNSGAISSTSGNISTTTGNITATAGTVQGQTLTSTGAANVGTNLAVGGNATVTGTLRGTIVTDGTASLTGGNLSGVGTLGASTVNATTVNATTINSTGTVTANTLAVGSGGVSVAAGAPISAGGNRIQNVATPVAPTDAANKAYVDAQLGVSNERLNEAFKRIDENAQGIAVAVAMSGLAMPAGKTFALGANIGFYDNKQAFALQTAIRLDDVVTLNGSVGIGTDSGKVGARIGFLAAW